MADTLEARVEALEDLVRRIADASIDGLDDMNARLARIDDQNLRIADGLQVLGVDIDDPDAHDR